MTQLDSDSRTLIAIRVVIVTTLLMAALLIQSTVDIVLPINYVYLVCGMAYAMTLLYIGAGKTVASRRVNLYLQLSGDLVVETFLVYFTGGIDSPFSFLYLVTIITAAMLMYRRAGMIMASLASILYGGLIDLVYYGALPLPPVVLFSPAPVSATRLYAMLATNFTGFYAAAVLTSYISEKLRVTYEELTANRENLAAIQALNESIIQSIPSGVITVSADGTITSINPAGCDILDLPGSAVIGRPIRDRVLFVAELWDESIEELHRTRIVRGEETFLRNGEVRTIGYAVTPLNPAVGDSGQTLIFQDLTEMKDMEAQLRMKDRMAAVGELAAGIAHEIRNPLAAIAGSVQVLRGSKGLTTQEQRLMSIVLRESDRLNKSIADFLRFVKPQEKVPVNFDIAASLGETLELLSNSPELNKSHRIVRSIDPPAFHIFGDPDQMRQVFWNLSRNAIQAMPDGGELRVATELSDDLYRIVFSDSGKGMSEADQHRMFQPFRTTFPSGTGLGMAICYRIVQGHAGRIDVSSASGGGTTITISLPLPAIEPRPAHPTVASSNALQ